MIKKLRIENLRGIASGTIDDMTLVNVIIGPNNAGKSTVLDALLLACSPNPATVAHRAVHRRKLADPSAWLLRRDKGEPATQCSLEVETDQGHVRTVHVAAKYDQGQTQLRIQPIWPEATVLAEMQTEMRRLQNDPVTNVLATSSGKGVPQVKAKINQVQVELTRKQQHGEPIAGTPGVHLIEPEFSDRQTPLHDLYTQVAERGLRSEAKRIVTDLIPELEDIEILTQQGQPIVYLDMRNGGALPVSIAGDGVRLLLALSFELARPEGGLALLEEPETHLHPAAVRQAARAIHAASGRGVQIVITTHSLDLIDSLLETFRENLDQLAFFRVRLDKGQLVATRHSGREAAVARTEIEEDLR